MEVGNIVCSLSGHDKGIYYAVLKIECNGVLLCDGKHRRLQNLKFKNPKHLKFTGYSLKPEQLVSDKAVRRGIFAVFSAYKEEI